MPSELKLVAAVALVVVLSAGFAVNRASSTKEGLILPDSREVNFVMMNQLNNGDALGEQYFDLNASISKIFAHLNGAEKTARQSVNDVPVNTDNNNYLGISMTLSDGITMRRLYLYSINGEYFVEEPYSGIYKTTREANVAIYKIYTDTEKRGLNDDYTADAFFAVTKKLYALDPGLNGGIKYIAVDLQNVPVDAAERLVEITQAWAESLNCELLVDTYDGLVKKGYIQGLDRNSPETTGDGFVEGVLFQFSTSSISIGGTGNAGSAGISASKYRAPLGAVYADFILTLKDGVWMVAEPENVAKA